MNILMIKIKPKYSIKKQKEQKKKKRKQNLRVCTQCCRQIAAIVPAGVEKILI